MTRLLQCLRSSILQFSSLCCFLYTVSIVNIILVEKRMSTLIYTIYYIASIVSSHNRRHTVIISFYFSGPCGVFDDKSAGAPSSDDHAPPVGTRVRIASAVLS